MGSLYLWLRRKPASIPALARQDHGLPQHQYFAGIDYAEKHDYTVGVIIHRVRRPDIVDRMDVVRLTRSIQSRFAGSKTGSTGRSCVPLHRIRSRRISDVSTIQKFTSRYPMHRFKFFAGRGPQNSLCCCASRSCRGRLAWYRAAACTPLRRRPLWQEEQPVGGSPIDDLTSELEACCCGKTQRAGSGSITGLTGTMTAASPLV